VGRTVSQFSEPSLEGQRHPSGVAFLRALARVCSLTMLAATPVLSACAPKLFAGEWQCEAEGGAAGAGPSEPAATDPVAVPWSTGFENSFCDYSNVAGFCYGDQPYVSVREPSHSGHLAAKFTVLGERARDHQTRCVRQGVLPESAYYGAWYYIPEALEDAKLWNLFHFIGGDGPGPNNPALWDVTLVHGTQDGEWELMVYDPVNGGSYRGADHRPIPFATWFHIEMFLKRASDSTGEIALYQDGVQLFDRVNLKSDASKFTQWYVGNLTDDMAVPADSSLYVDDISISATLSDPSATQ